MEPPVSEIDQPIRVTGSDPLLRSSINSFGSLVDPLGLGKTSLMTISVSDAMTKLDGVMSAPKRIKKANILNIREKI